jgi:hypothetical protein
MARLLLYLPLLFVAVDEPCNGLTTRLALALTGRSPREEQPASGRPVIGISDITELHRSDKPARIQPQPVAPAMVPLLAPSSAPGWVDPVATLALVLEHVPDHVPLRC